MRLLAFFSALLTLAVSLSTELSQRVKEKLYSTAVAYYESGNYVGALELFTFLGNYKNSTAYRGELLRFFTDAPPVSLFAGKEPFIRLKAAANFRFLKVYCPSGSFGVRVQGGRFALNNLRVSGVISFRSDGCKIFVDRGIIEAPPRSEARLLFYKGKPLLVIAMPLETYVAGVLPGEVYMRWGEEVLKAQAVAARTFALYSMAKRKDQPYDADATTLFQHFVGFGGLNPKAVEVAEKTRGEVLVYKGRLVYAMYSSNDGGCSHSFEELFGVKIPYLSRTEVGKVCNLENLKWSRWERFLPRGRIKGFLSSLGVENAEVSTLEVVRNDCGRGLRIRFFLSNGDVLELPLTFFVRLSLRLPSDWFYPKGVYPSGFELEGRGFGHGLGMSQWGAYCLGEKGWDYKRILEFFYRGAAVEKIY